MLRQLTDVTGVFVSDGLEIFQEIALRRRRARCRQWPVLSVVVRRMYNVVEGGNLHIAEQRNHLEVFKNSIDFSNSHALLLVEFVDVRHVPVDEEGRESEYL